MTEQLPSIQEIARRLGGEVSGGQVLAPGPGHSPKDRSLSIKIDPNAPDGFVVHSHANDDWQVCRDYVRERCGAGAFEPKSNQTSSFNIFKARPSSDEQQEPGPEAKPEPEPETACGGGIGGHATEYIYRDKDGTPHLKVTRTPQKKFYQSHWDAEAQVWRKGATRLAMLPYRLPEMLAAVHDTVFITEGEKDADRLAALKFVATTNPMGAGKWKPELNAWFNGKDVYILPDNDGPGRKHAQQVARNLNGVAATVRICPLPGLAEKGDISDWLEAGGDTSKLVDICKKHQVWSPQDVDAPDNRTRRKDNSPKTISIDAAALKNMKFPPVRWIVEGILQHGCTILAGKPKLGKSWLALDIALQVARGSGSFVLGDRVCGEGDVLYLALEDNQRRLQDRIRKVSSPLQEWPKRLTLTTEAPRADDGGKKFIADWASAAENPLLVLVDVLGAFRSAPKSGDKRQPYQIDYDTVAELRDLCAESSVAVLIIHHTRKSDADDANDQVSGTLGLTGAADATLVLSSSAAKGTTIYGRGRDTSEFEYSLDFLKESCRWTIRGETSDVIRSDQRAKILEVLGEAGEALTPNEVTREIGGKPANVRQLIRTMANQGVIMKSARGKYQYPVQITDVDAAE